MHGMSAAATVVASCVFLLALPDASAFHLQPGAVATSTIKTLLLLLQYLFPLTTKVLQQ